MLTKPLVNRPRAERKLRHDPRQATTPLGCHSCPEREVCGGLRTRIPVFDCLHNCCGGAPGCDVVCRNNREFVARAREVRGFSLDNVPQARPAEIPVLPVVAPLILHGSGRARFLEVGTAAIPFAGAMDWRRGLPKHADGKSLRAAFGLSPSATLLLSGIDLDARIEKWWGLGIDGRRTAIAALAQMEVGLVTTPNYSLLLDRPRWDDLHAMKRIAIVAEEFMAAGVPTALHVNGRTDRDCDRWAGYIARRPEITHVAFEFTTGPSRADRIWQHATWLGEIARRVGRPLHLVVRGGSEVWPMLAAVFAGLTVLDTSAFMKTINRQRALVLGRLTWVANPTPFGEPIDDLLADNWRTIEAWTRAAATSVMASDG